MSQSLPSWKVISSRVIHTTPWIEVIEDTCEVGEKTIVYTYTKRVDEGPLIIAEETDGRIWLVQQYRHPIKKTIWQFPVEGKLEDESWENAAKRGLQEELHLQAETWGELGTFYPDPGSLQQQYKVYVATNLSSVEQSHLPVNEEVEDLIPQAFSWKEIRQLIQAGAICDNWTLSGLFLYQQYKQ